MQYTAITLTTLLLCTLSACRSPSPPIMDDTPEQQAIQAVDVTDRVASQHMTDYQRRLKHTRAMHTIRNRAGGGGGH